MPTRSPSRSPSRRQPGRRGRTRKVAGILLIVVLLAVIAAHLLLPSVILRIVNRELADIPGYHAHIEDLDISLLRGAYTLDDLRFRKVEGDDTLPVFSARHVDFSVEWGALFRGKVVGEITLTAPRLTIFPAPAAPPDDTASFAFSDLQETLRNLFPFTINRFEIKDGALHFKDPARTPPVDIRLDDIDAVARGLTNAQQGADRDASAPEQGTRVEEDKEDSTHDTAAAPREGARKRDALPATFRLTARAMDHAPLVINLALAPLAESPTFDLDAELTSLDLTTLNSFFRAYAGVDVERGTFSVYTEVAAADGRFAGYVKPLTRDIKVLDLDTDEGNLISMAWEALVAGAAKLLENPPEVQVGTKIPFRGTFSDPEPEIWSTIAYLLRNAFIRALQPGLENSIQLEGGPTLEEQKTQEDKEAEQS